MNEIFDLLGLGGIGMSSPTWDVSEQQFIGSVGSYNQFGKRMMEAERQQAMHDFVGPTGQRHADQAASQQRLVDVIRQRQERAAECWQREIEQRLGWGFDERLIRQHREADNWLRQRDAAQKERLERDLAVEYEQRIAAIELKYARRRRQIDRKYRNRFKLWRTAGLVLRWWWKRHRPARPAGYEKGRRFEVKRRLTDVERAYWGVE